MFKAKTLNDFKELQSLIEELNQAGIWKLKIEIKKDNSECDLYIVDHTEELYYGGCLFDSTLERLDNALKVDTGDSDAFFDCICPGRWIADFKGRDRYTEETMRLDIHIATMEAMYKYMKDNGLEPNWTEETKKKFDELAYISVELIKEILRKVDRAC